MRRLSFSDIALGQSRKPGRVGIKLEKINAIVEWDKVLDLVKVVDKTNAMVGGVHHHVSGLQDYLDEYCYRFNRSFMKEGIFENPMLRMVNSSPCPIKNISS